METVKADNRQRVRIPDIKPGQVFALELYGNVVKLTPVQPVEEHPPAKCKLVKRNGFTVIETDRVVSQERINELLSELP